MLFTMPSTVRLALVIVLLASIHACASPLATYREVQTDYSKSVANIVVAQQGYYDTANKLAIRSYLDSKSASLESANYGEMKGSIVISPEQRRVRAEVLSQLSAFSVTMLSIALAKDAEEFKATALQAGKVAGNIADELKKAGGSISNIVPGGGIAVKAVPAGEAIKTAGAVIGEVGKYLIEARTESRLDQAYTKENMRKVNDALLFLADDMIDFANRLESIVIGDSGRAVAGFNLYVAYVKSLRGRWIDSRDKAFLEARAGFPAKRDEVVDVMTRLLHIQGEPATEGLMALRELNDALVVYAHSKQGPADKKALMLRAKTALSASTAVVESLEFYKPTIAAEKARGQAQ